jgi:hypothetical protein
MMSADTCKSEKESDLAILWIPNQLIRKFLPSENFEKRRGRKEERSVVRPSAYSHH